MKSSGTSDHLVTRSILASPKSFLNCQALSIHLPPPSPAQNSSSRSAYISPPMSASSRFPQALKSPRSQAKHQRQRSTPPLTDPSAPAHLGSFNGRRAPDASLQPQQLRKSPTEGRRNIRETDVDRPNTPVTLGGGTPPPAEGSNDECSPRTQGSSNAPQSNSDSPNIARRAKAHVPSACVNCKRKHLACETRRPCSRCVQAGKEVSDKKMATIQPSLTESRRLVSMFSTRNAVGRGFEKKKMTGEMALVAATYTRTCISDNPTWHLSQPLRSEALVERDLIANCAPFLAHTMRTHMQAYICPEECQTRDMLSHRICMEESRFGNPLPPGRCPSKFLRLY